MAGTIFASPSAEQIRKAATDCVDTDKGIFIIPMNYTGDVLNFGMAAEKARAAGIKTEFFAINDDVGVGRKKGGKVGRRGIAGGILILKIVGALAEAGYVIPTHPMTLPLTPAVGPSMRSIALLSWRIRMLLPWALPSSTSTSLAARSPRIRSRVMRSRLAWVFTMSLAPTASRRVCRSWFKSCSARCSIRMTPTVPTSHGASPTSLFF